MWRGEDFLKKQKNLLWLKKYSLPKDNRSFLDEVDSVTIFGVRLLVMLRAFVFPAVLDLQIYVKLLRREAPEAKKMGVFPTMIGEVKV